MPKKIQTENQFARLIGATPLQIDLHLIRMSEHTTKNTAAEHMATFYRPFQEVKGEKFDGLKDAPGFAQTHLVNGQPPAVGHILQQPTLGRTLEQLAEVVQRALAELESKGQVRAIGQARARRWVAAPLVGFTTILLLPTTQPNP